MNPGWICDLCGNEFPPADQPPTRCPICADDRQFIPRSGPSWSELNPAADNELTAAELEPGFWQLTIRPSVGIGQHTYVIESTDGNVLWEPPGFIGALLTGDTIMAVPHPEMVSFMRSFPNLIPLSPRLVRGIADRVAELRFDRIYAAFGAPVAPKAAEIVASSAQRYIDWVTDAQMDPDERNGQASG